MRLSRNELSARVSDALKPNALERFITRVAPTYALKRMNSRVTMAVASGYVGASKSRRSLKEWKTIEADADSATLDDLPTLRERSQDLIRNVPIATGAINTKVTNVIGSGLKLKSSIDFKYLGMTDIQAAEWQLQAEREWKCFSETQECDTERTQNFCQLTSLAFRSMLENGDVFSLMPFIKRPGSEYGLKVQLVEADRVSNPNNNQDTSRLRAGVETDVHGAPLRYHISNIHPGNKIGQERMVWTAVDAYNAKTGKRTTLHLIDRKRIGLTRGVPDLSPVIEALKQLGRYTESELDATVLASFFTVFTKTEAAKGLNIMQPVAETGATTTDDDVKIGKANIVDLAPGEDIEIANPGRPNDSFDPFVQAVLRQVGTALELPFEVLIKHFTASYSAARAALLDLWKYVLKTRKFMVDMFCQPYYEALITESVARGKIAAPGFLTDPLIRKAYLGSEWVGPSKGNIQPAQEANAEKTWVEMGVKTLSEVTAETTGGDWEQKQHQRIKENMMLKESATGQDDKAPESEPDDNEDDKKDNENKDENGDDDTEKGDKEKGDMETEKKVEP